MSDKNIDYELSVNSVKAYQKTIYIAETDTEEILNDLRKHLESRKMCYKGVLNNHRQKGTSMFYPDKVYDEANVSLFEMIEWHDQAIKSILNLK